MNLQYITYQQNIYRKIGIYNRNTKFINEGYHGLSNNISFNSNEKLAINEIFQLYQDALIDQYINESLKDKLKDFVQDAEKIGNLIKNLLENIPSKVLKAYDYLQKLINNGISTVKEFLEGLTKLFQILGENLKDVFQLLGFYKDEFINELPDEEDSSKEIDKVFNVQDEKERKLLNYISKIVQLGMSNKSASDLMLTESISFNRALLNEGNIEYGNINEGKVTDFVKDHSKGIAAASILCPPVGAVALLAGGGYGLYKLLGLAGNVLSNKLEPILLSDKMKDFSEKLYNNKFFRYSLGLVKNKTKEEDESKLHYAGRLLHTILLNGICAWIISVGLSLILSSIFPINPVTVKLIVSIIICGKNIFRIIINRINNFNKEVKDKNGNIINKKFFDLVTMVGMLASISTVILNIPGVKDAISSAFGKVFALTSETAKADIKTGQTFGAHNVDYKGGKVILSDNIQYTLKNQIIGTYGDGKVGVLDAENFVFNRSAAANENLGIFYMEQIPYNELDDSTKEGLLKAVEHIITNEKDTAIQLLNTDAYGEVKYKIFQNLFGKDSKIAWLLFVKQPNKFKELILDNIGNETANSKAISDLFNKFIADQNCAEIANKLTKEYLPYNKELIGKISQYIGLDSIDSKDSINMILYNILHTSNGEIRNIAFAKTEQDAILLLKNNLSDAGIKIINRNITSEFNEKLGGYIVKYN